MPESAVHKRHPSLHFELYRIEGSLEEINVAVVGGDDEVAFGPLGVFVSADHKFEVSRRQIPNGNA